MSVAEIAKESGVSNTTVCNRLKVLKRNGIIKGSLTMVDLSKFGYSLIAHLRIQVFPAQIDEAVRHVSAMKGVTFCASTIGSYNLIAFLVLIDNDELQKIIDLIKKEPSVIEVKAGIWTSLEKALARPQNINLSDARG